MHVLNLPMDAKLEKTDDLQDFSCAPTSFRLQWLSEEISALALRSQRENDHESQNRASLENRQSPLVSNTVAQSIFDCVGGRAKQYSELIYKSWEQTTDRVWRQFVQMGRHHSPGTLDAH